MSTTHSIVKFGGSSLASSSAWRKVIDHIRKERVEQPVIVVVSAIGKTTRSLVGCVEYATRAEIDKVDRGLTEIWQTHKEIALECTEDAQSRTKLEEKVDTFLHQLHVEAMSVAKELQGHSSPLSSSYGDAMLSFGERATSQIFQWVLQSSGVPSLAVDAREVIQTDEQHGAANVSRDKLNPALMQHPALASFWSTIHSEQPSSEVPIPVLGGFIGRSPSGQPTTLGFEGSDLTATLIAEATGAMNVTIFTDVDGIMTTDPRLVPTAKHIPNLSYDEAEDLALAGARILHPQTLRPVMSQGIPVRVRNTFNEDHPGTLIGFSRSSLDHSSPTISSDDHTPFRESWSAIAMALTHLDTTTSMLTFLHATPEGQAQLRQWSEIYALPLEIDTHGWHLHVPHFLADHPNPTFPFTLQAIHDIFFP